MEEDVAYNDDGFNTNQQESATEAMVEEEDDTVNSSDTSANNTEMQQEDHQQRHLQSLSSSDSSRPKMRRRGVYEVWIGDDDSRVISISDEEVSQIKVDPCFIVPENSTAEPRIFHDRHLSLLPQDEVPSLQTYCLDTLCEDDTLSFFVDSERVGFIPAEVFDRIIKYRRDMAKVSMTQFPITTAIPRIILSEMRRYENPTQAVIAARHQRLSSFFRYDIQRLNANPSSLSNSASPSHQSSQNATSDEVEIAVGEENVIHPQPQKRRHSNISSVLGRILSHATIDAEELDKESNQNTNSNGVRRHSSATFQQVVDAVSAPPSLLGEMHRSAAVDTPGVMLHPLISQHARSLLISSNITPPPQSHSSPPTKRSNTSLSNSFTPMSTQSSTHTRKENVMFAVGNIDDGDDGDDDDDDDDEEEDNSYVERDGDNDDVFDGANTEAVMQQEQEEGNDSNGDIDADGEEYDERHAQAEGNDFKVKQKKKKAKVSPTGANATLPVVERQDLCSARNNRVPSPPSFGHIDTNNPERILITRVHLHSCHSLKRQDLCFLVDQPIREFSFTRAKLSHTFFNQAMLCWKDSLVYLNLHNTAVRSDTLLCLRHLRNLKYLDISNTKVFNLPPLPQLEILHAEKSRITSAMIIELSQCSRYLRELYLTRTSVNISIFVALCVMPRLRCLSIASCKKFCTSHSIVENANVQQFFLNQFKDIAAKNLEWLDVSFTSAPADFFSLCKENFPNLKYLGLAGTPAASSIPNSFTPESSKIELGVLEKHRSCVISFLVNTPLYCHSAMLDGLHALYRNLSSSSSSGNLDWIKKEPAITLLAVNVIWEYMESASSTDALLIASACLFYSTWKNFSCRCVRMEAVAVCKAMLHVWMDNSQLIKNTCLILKNFSHTLELVPFDEELVLLLFTACEKHRDATIRESAMQLCCSLLGRMDADTKESMIVNDGIFEILLSLMEPYRLETPLTNEDIPFYEQCWVFLWDITDESPVAAEAILNLGGDVYMRNALKDLSHIDIIRNVLGLVSNIAEVANLREKLIQSSILPLLFDCLTIPDSHDLEVEYNATGVLCQVFSHPALHPDITNRIHRVVVDTVNRWDPNSDRRLNYRSLYPVINLLGKEEPVRQYWGIWAIQNLCFTKPERYCPMFLEEGGYEYILKLASMELESSSTQNGTTEAESNNTLENKDDDVRFKIKKIAAAVLERLDLHIAAHPQEQPPP